MSDGDNDDVKIFPPDKTLQTKIGYADLKLILTPQAIEAAQETIHQSADQFFDEGMSHLQQLEEAWKALKASPSDLRRHMTSIINASFSIKAKTGLAGYDLAAVLARSLQLHCEQITDEFPTGKSVELIEWHIASIKKILNDKIKGFAGEIGIAIREELKRLNKDITF